MRVHGQCTTICILHAWDRIMNKAKRLLSACHSRTFIAI